MRSSIIVAKDIHKGNGRNYKEEQQSPSSFSLGSSKQVDHRLIDDFFKEKRKDGKDNSKISKESRQEKQLCQHEKKSIIYSPQSLPVAATPFFPGSFLSRVERMKQSPPSQIETRSKKILIRQEHQTPVVDKVSLLDFIIEDTASYSSSYSSSSSSSSSPKLRPASVVRSTSTTTPEFKHAWRWDHSKKSRRVFKLSELNVTKKKESSRLGIGAEEIAVLANHDLPWSTHFDAIEHRARAFYAAVQPQLPSILEHPKITRNHEEEEDERQKEQFEAEKLNDDCADLEDLKCLAARMRSEEEDEIDELSPEDLIHLKDLAARIRNQPQNQMLGFHNCRLPIGTLLPFSRQTNPNTTNLTSMISAFRASRTASPHHHHDKRPQILAKKQQQQHSEINNKATSSSSFSTKSKIKRRRGAQFFVESSAAEDNRIEEDQFSLEDGEEIKATIRRPKKVGRKQLIKKQKQFKVSSRSSSPLQAILPKRYRFTVSEEEEEEDGCDDLGSFVFNEDDYEAHITDAQVEELDDASLFGGYEKLQQQKAARLKLARLARANYNNQVKKNKKKLIRNKESAASQEEDQQLQSCTICLENSSPRESGQIDCGHTFCYACIHSWSNVTNQCPMCRKEFLSIIKWDKHDPFSKTTTISVRRKKQKVNELDYEGEAQAIQDEENLLAAANTNHQHQLQPQQQEDPSATCYRCLSSEEDHLLLICDVCDANYCHTFCDESIEGDNQIVPEGRWSCHECRG